MFLQALQETGTGMVLASAWLLGMPQEAYSHGKGEVEAGMSHGQSRSKRGATHFFVLFGFVFELEFCSCCPGWSTMTRSQLTATSASWVQVIFLPQHPK